MASQEQAAPTELDLFIDFFLRTGGPDGAGKIILNYEL